MVRLIALLAAILLMGIAAYLGYEATILDHLSVDTLHSNAFYLGINYADYLDLVGPLGISRALLAIAAMIPVPALLRIATDRG